MVKKIQKKDRNKTNRKVKNIVLIAAEGNNKTETIYFASLNQSQSSFRIMMAKGNKTDPVGIVEDLLKTMKSERIDPEIGDLAVCVFDTDFAQFKSFQIENARKLANKHNIEIIISNPCFEVWFIEHFGYTTKHFNSNADVIDELKKMVPDYTKSKNLSGVLNERTDQAIANCQKLEAFHDTAGNKGMDRNPSSEVYKIVETIIGH